MKKPILHPRTETALKEYLAQPAHGLLLSGKKGMGKRYVAEWLASELGSHTITITAPEGKTTISIDQIRSLYQLTRTGSSLVVIIENAQQLGVDAQNAFLKLLEEPPQNTYFILTVNYTGAVLPTIRSRCQTIEMVAPKKEDLLVHTAADQTATSLLHTTEGLPGAFFTQLADRQYLEKHQALVAAAKQFYSQTIYQRHRMLAENKYDTSYARELLALLAVIIQSLLHQNAHDVKVAKKLLSQATLIETTTYNITRINGNPKIHLTKLAQNL